MSKTRFALRTLLACSLLFAAEACAADGQEPLRVGFIGPLSGDAAVLGVDALPAVEIAIADERRKDGLGIELLVEDDQYQTAKALSAYESLVRVKKAEVLFVFTYGALFTLEKRVQDDGVLVIDTLDCDEHIAKLPDNFICISKTTENLGRVAAEAAIERGDDRAAFIYYESDPFMRILGLASKERLEELGGKAVLFEGYRAGTSDFKSLLLRANRLEAKSFFFYGYDDLGTALPQARALGMKQQFYGWNCVGSPGFRASSRGAEEGMIISTFMAPRNEAVRGFLAEFKRRTGREPSFEVSTFPSYDALKLLAAGYRLYLQSDRRTRRAAFLRDYLLSVKDYRGLSGAITIDPDGATRSIKNAPYQVTGGALRLLGRRTAGS